MSTLNNPELFWWIVTPLLVAALAGVAVAVVYRLAKNAYDRRAEALEREAAELHGERVARPHTNM